MDTALRLRFEDVFGILGTYSERIVEEIIQYLDPHNPRTFLPAVSAEDRSAMSELLPIGRNVSDSPSRAVALAIHRPGWHVHDHDLARRNLHAALAGLGFDGDDLILRFSRVLQTLSGHSEGIQGLPNSIACLLRDATVVRTHRERFPCYSAERLVRLLDAEGEIDVGRDAKSAEGSDSDWFDARDVLVQLFLDDRLPIASWCSHLGLDMADAADFLVDSETTVLALCDSLGPKDVRLVLTWAERHPRLAEFSAPLLVRAVVDGEAWHRGRLLAVLRTIPLSAYREQLIAILQTCSTARLPRAITIAESQADSVAGAQIIHEARQQSTGPARRRLLDAAEERLAQIVFAPLSVPVTDPPPGDQIADAPLSEQSIAELRAALENRRQRARALARRRAQGLDDRWRADRNREDMLTSLAVAEECERLLANFAAVVASLEGNSPLPAGRDVFDETLVARLGCLTTSQLLRLVCHDRRIVWPILSPHLPLPGATARSILDFAETAGIDPGPVGLSFVRLALRGYPPLWVIPPEAMWPVVENYLDELDQSLGLAVDTETFRTTEQILAALDLFGAAPGPLERYLPVVRALATGRSGAVRDRARAVLERYGVRQELI